MSLTDDRDRQAPGAGPQAELSYVLVADADVQRTAACLESIKPFKVGVLVARDGEEALGIVHRFGAPILLITDLSLPRKDGFAVIEAVRDIDAGRSEIIAWSALRELREFAAHRLVGLNVKILSGSASPAVLRGAIERALRGNSHEPRSVVTAPAPTIEDVHRMMAGLADRVRELSTAAGVAVYFRAQGQKQFRAAVTWTSDVPMPDAPPHLPRVFDLVVESRDALVLPDLAAHPLPGMPRSVGSESVRGIVAVPIVSHDAIVGAICVFDVEPLDIGDDGVNALKALGRSAGARPSPLAEDTAAADRPAREVRPEPVRHAEHVEHVENVENVDRVDDVEAPPPFEPVSLLDRRGGGLAIARELARVRREQRQLSLVLFDVDPTRAGSGSDYAGAPDALEAVSDTLTRAIRGSDLAIQWSREELLVVLPGLSATEARPVAERVRAAMQAGARHRVFVAGGVAELMTNETVESAVARANEKLRLARERGHNRVG